MYNQDMAIKEIDFICAPADPHWVGDGFLMHNFIPYTRGLSMRDMDPFIMLDYGTRLRVSPSATPKGVGVHPHRGFETVTLAYHGEAEHHDSKGNHGILREGDVQWMTAGRGVLHKEYHARDWSRKGGDFQMVQLWVNLPARDKMTEPAYQAISSSIISRVAMPENSGTVEVVAGEYRSIKGPARTFSPVSIMNAKLHKGGRAEFSFPALYNTALLAVEGNAVVNGAELPQGHLLKFAHEGESFTIESVADGTVVLVISGEPLNEPIAAYGPFVMNTEAEIHQAINDINSGKFGYLED